MNPDTAWRRFEAPGKIEDYLQYKQTEQGGWQSAQPAGGDGNADHNLWNGPAGENP